MRVEVPPTVIRKNISWLETRAALRDFKEPWSPTEGLFAFMRAGLSWFRILGDIVHFLSLGLHSRTSLAAENLFLRKQLAFYQERKVKPRRADNPTRFTLVLLSRWFNWQDALTIVRPRTFVTWHRKGFRLFWRWKSEAGRRPIPAELRQLIRKMARDNPSWGEERIANELLLKLGLRVSPRTVRNYMPELPVAPASGPRGDQRWATFLKHHARVIIACDFCVAVTATFRILYVLVVMEHTSRRLIQLNATAHPTAAWDSATAARDHSFRPPLSLHHPRPRRDLFRRTGRFADSARP